MFREVSTAQRCSGIILAGVHHWDIQSLDHVMPRCLAPVALTPLVGHVLRWFVAGGVSDVSICANSATGAVRRCLGDGSAFGSRLAYYEDRTPRGPAGCVRDAAVATESDILIVADGSQFPRFDLRDLVNAHRASGATLTAALTSYDTTTGRNDGRLRPVGIYAISSKALSYVSDTSYQDIKEGLIPRLREAGENVLPFVVHESAPRASNLYGYLSMQEYVLGRIAAGEIRGSDFVRMGDAMVHTSAHVSSDARLFGRCVIGPRTRVERGAVIVGPTVVGSDCRIETHAVVSRSAIWDEARIGQAAFVDSSVVAFNSSVRPGVTLRHTLASNDAAIWRPRPHREFWTHVQSAIKGHDALPHRRKTDERWAEVAS